ncbi:MAG: hypothetical protein ABI898_01415 [Sphingomonadales bacterium]
MTTMKAALLAILVLVSTGSPVAAQWYSRGDQDQAYQGRREGALKSLREIENSIVPRMKARGADYIGAEFDGGAGSYRLKFMRGGSVIWVDVDGRTGAVLARAGD